MVSFSNGGLPLKHRQEGGLSRKREKTKQMMLQLSKFHLILNFLLTCASVYVNTKHPHKDTQTPARVQIHDYQKKYTIVLAHSTIPPIKDVGKAVRLPQSETGLFIYLREFRVITGITAALGCDISL